MQRNFWMQQKESDLKLRNGNNKIVRKNFKSL